MSANIIDVALAPPTAAELENALQTLVDEIIDYRVKRENKHTTRPMVALTMTALCETPRDVMTAIDWVERPVDVALKRGIKAVGQLIFA